LNNAIAARQAPGLTLARELRARAAAIAAN
jgi:hypothetical protein